MKTIPVLRTTVTHCRSAARKAAAVLRRGGLVVFPTDTVYGVAADPNAPGALGRLIAAKGRDRRKQIPLLLDGGKSALRLARSASRSERRLMDRFWPGPMTLVLRTGPRSTEGCRVPDHPVALAILRAAGGMLRVTSANRSGEPAALTAAEAVKALGDCVDLVVDAGRAPGGIASTVVRVDGERLRILREGALPRETLRGCLKVSPHE
jgi:L-threonylcarbamoyladenylate synthase